MVWLHASPAYIADGAFVVPASELGGRSRSHPNGYGDDELRWYSPDRVYVFDGGTVDPRHHLGRFTFARDDYFLYEVDPVGPLGTDADFGTTAMNSATCARARVVRCVHEPDLPVISADLSAVAADGGCITVTVADWPEQQRPALGRRVILRDAGLSKAAIVQQLHEDGSLLVDVVGDRIRPLSF